MNKYICLFLVLISFSAAHAVPQTCPVKSQAEGKAVDAIFAAFSHSFTAMDLGYFQRTLLTQIMQNHTAEIAQMGEDAKQVSLLDAQIFAANNTAKGPSVDLVNTHFDEQVNASTHALRLAREAQIEVSELLDSGFSDETQISIIYEDSFLENAHNAHVAMTSEMKHPYNFLMIFPEEKTLNHLETELFIDSTQMQICSTDGDPTVKVCSTLKVAKPKQDVVLSLISDGTEDPCGIVF